MNIDGIEKTIWDENILFYRILKWLIQSKVKSSVLFDLQVLIERNKNKNLDSKSWYELIISVLNYKTNGESNNISELLLTNNKNVNNFIIFLDFAISLFQLKELLWEEVKTFTNSRFVKKISSINDPLSIEYDISSLEYPYSFRVIFSLIIDMLIRLDNDKSSFILNTSNNEILKLNEKIKFLSKNSNLNSAAVFNLIISESVNQSIKSTAGSSYEARVKEKFLEFKENIELLNNSHDSKVHSVEYDFIVKYNKFNIGISAKRTLRERYKQNSENVSELDVDAMIVVTLGLDLTEKVMNNILQKKGQYILVSQEIYKTKEFLKRNNRVFSSEDFDFSMLKIN
ncbi:hypothetical protein [Spiroplasma endosymbiont of Monopis laevigella]|uniref:hypothetical protein n=1 Tax=Spiroplasma endosymbiont of Monopis laevigella TaxID=3066312 RepID=UPI0030CD3DDA